MYNLSMNDEIIFAPEDLDTKIRVDGTYKILIIDDDEEVHLFTKLALKSFVFRNKKIEFLSAHSEKQAREMLPLHDDLAVILLDVVMEKNTSGLDLAEYIRSDLKNDMSRIIIRTGQPGEAPERYVIDNYDINDYKEKTELTADKLYTTIRTALVQYMQLIELNNKKNEIYNLLITDKLTSLPNRAKLNYDLDSNIHQTLMLIDIDRFSLLNDAYGFDVGDQVLLHMSNILSRILKKGMILYRLEADVFALLLNNAKLDTLDDEVLTIKALLDNSPLELENLSLYISVSIGIVHYQLGNIIQKAEIALRQAREVSRNRVEYYDENRDYLSFIEENNSWTARIANALHSDRLLVYYQPIVECKTDKIVKYEALVRLEYEGVVYSPYKFLKTARYAGYLHQITQRVFKKACEKFQDNKLIFSVNITDHDLAEDKFVEFIDATAKEYGIEKSRIVFEILEETSMNGNIVALENLKRLTSLGYSLSIDDFGAECSNFSQLGKHKYESIKIDGSFIKDIDTDRNSQIITESILFFTNKVGFKTVAEFVHSKEIYEIVKSMGVDYAQGYYFGEPKPELIEL